MSCEQVSGQCLSAPDHFSWSSGWSNQWVGDQPPDPRSKLVTQGTYRVWACTADGLKPYVNIPNICQYRCAWKAREWGSVKIKPVRIQQGGTGSGHPWCARSGERCWCVGRWRHCSLSLLMCVQCVCTCDQVCMCSVGPRAHLLNLLWFLADKYLPIIRRIKDREWITAQFTFSHSFFHHHFFCQLLLGELLV